MSYINIHKGCHIGQYEEAEKEKSFKRLLPYPCQLVKWQLHHPEDAIRIGKIESHVHGLFHYSRCPRPLTDAHPLPHGSCGDDCQKIGKWMKKTLRENLVFILRNRVADLPQQNLI